MNSRLNNTKGAGRHSSDSRTMGCLTHARTLLSSQLARIILQMILWSGQASEINARGTVKWGSQGKLIEFFDK
jgi:hypothetical protein